MLSNQTFDSIIVGGGPAGATAAHQLALKGHRVLLLDRGGRIKPCGGAIPPRLIEDFHIPETQIVARAKTARMISPTGRQVDMPIEGGSVGMVDREHFDEWLRVRAASAGASRKAAEYVGTERDGSGQLTVLMRPSGSRRDAPIERLRTRTLIGADGARSKVAEDEIKAERPPSVFAYHEIVRSPITADGEAFHPKRCEIYYDGKLSPDFYAWVFPHGSTTSIGVGSAEKGFSLRGAVASLRKGSAFEDMETIRTEGAPIPLKPL